MGRRKKAAKKVTTKKRPTVAKVFKCLYCSHEGSVSCKLDFDTKTADLSCRVCDAKYQTTINSLSEPIDVFSEWLDETSALQAEANKRHRTGNEENADEQSEDEEGGRDTDRAANNDDDLFGDEDES